MQLGYFIKWVLSDGLLVWLMLTAFVGIWIKVSTFLASDGRSGG